MTSALSLAEERGGRCRLFLLSGGVFGLCLEGFRGAEAFRGGGERVLRLGWFGGVAARERPAWRADPGVELSSFGVCGSEVLRRLFDNFIGRKRDVDGGVLAGLCFAERRAGSEETS
jgi:hypothetical protein